MNIIETIKEAYPKLSKVQKRMASHCLDNPDIASYQTIREFAKSTQSTDATVLKFCNNVSCSSYLMLKRQLQEYVHHLWLTPNDKLRRSAERFTNNKPGYAQLIEEAIQCLESTSQSIKKDDLEKAVLMVSNADNLIVAGHRLTSIPAEYLSYLLQCLGKKAQMLDMEDRTRIESILTHLTQNDAVILFSLPHYATITLQAAHYLFDKDIPVVAITDSESAPFTRYAKAVLTCNTNHSILFNSLSGTITLCELLVSKLLIENHSSYQSDWNNFEIIRGYLGTTVESTSIDPPQIMTALFTHERKGESE